MCYIMNKTGEAALLGLQLKGDMTVIERGITLA
jgi:hypothetical protein